MENIINNKNNPLNHYVREYLLHLEFERRLSKNTLLAYSYDLNCYIDFMYVSLKISNINCF